MNNTLEGISRRITEAEEQISDLEDKKKKSQPQNRILQNKQQQPQDLWEVYQMSGDPRVQGCVCMRT